MSQKIYEIPQLCAKFDSYDLFSPKEWTNTTWASLQDQLTEINTPTPMSIIVALNTGYSALLNDTRLAIDRLHNATKLYYNSCRDMECHIKRKSYYTFCQGLLHKSSLYIQYKRRAIRDVTVKISSLDLAQDILSLKSVYSSIFRAERFITDMEKEQIAADAAAAAALANLPPMAPTLESNSTNATTNSTGPVASSSTNKLPWYRRFWLAMPWVKSNKNSTVTPN